MTKQRFVSELRTRLSGLPRVDLEDSVLFYSKRFDSITDNGYTEDFAAAELGDVDEIADGILSAYPLSKIVAERIRSLRRPDTREIALLVLGSPIWLSLSIAAAAVMLSVYIILCAVVILMWVIGASLEVICLIAAAWGVLIMIHGDILTGAAVLGAGLCGVGLSSLTFFGSHFVTKGLRALTQKVFFGIKKSLVGAKRAPDRISAAV